MENTTIIEGHLARLRAGDLAARDALIERSVKRLEDLARPMFHNYPKLRRFAQTMDVFQKAVIRLRKALETVQPVPATVRDYLGLAARQIRWVLDDMVKQFKNAPLQASILKRSEDDNDAEFEKEDSDARFEAENMAKWVEFYEKIEHLPEKYREIWDLHYYQGLPHEEVAKLLGVSTREIERRWAGAKARMGAFVPVD